MSGPCRNALSTRRYAGHARVQYQHATRVQRRRLRGRADGAGPPTGLSRRARILNGHGRARVEALQPGLCRGVVRVSLLAGVGAIRRQHAAAGDDRVLRHLREVLESHCPAAGANRSLVDSWRPVRCPRVRRRHSRRTAIGGAERRCEFRHHATATALVYSSSACGTAALWADSWQSFRADQRVVDPIGQWAHPALPFWFVTTLVVLTRDARVARSRCPRVRRA